jgi:hypothetical protein
MFAHAVRNPAGASDAGTFGGPRRRAARFGVWEWLGIPRVSAGFARPVQEDSPHLDEFPEGI